MRISPIKIIGSLVYQTRESLNKDVEFMQKLNNYYYKDNLLEDGRFCLWHYPGTPSEISKVLQALTQSHKTKYLRFPAVFNFQSIKQEVGEDIAYTYNLAFVAPTNSEWLTEEREMQTFDCVLRPLYESFLEQVNNSGYFTLDFGHVKHTCYEVFTTGNKEDEIIYGRYGEYLDAIEIQNLTLTLKNMCYKHKDRIDEENRLVTEKE